MRKKMYLPLVAVPVVAALVLGASYMPYLTDGKITSVSTGLYGILTPEQRMQMADIIVIGKVVGVDTEVYWFEGDFGEDVEAFRVMMVYEIEPEEFVKGHSDKNLIVKVLGGETDEYKTVGDNLILKHGDRVVMNMQYSEKWMHYIPAGGVYNTYLIGDDGIAENAKNKRISLEQLEDGYDKILENMTRARP